MGRLIQKSEWQITDQLPSANAPVGDVYVIATEPKPDIVLTHASGGADNGTVITFWTFNSVNPKASREQQWFIVPTGDSKIPLNGKSYTPYYIIGRHSGRSLAVRGDSEDEDQAPVIVFDWNSKYESQKWLFIPAGKDSYYIHNVRSNRKLICYGENVENGSRLVLNWQYFMPFKLKKATEFALPKPPSVESDDSALNRLKITWQGKEPLLPDTTMPFSTTYMYVPAIFVTDSGFSTFQDKIDQSPYYMLEKQSFAHEVVSLDNTTGDEGTAEYSYSSGISETNSQSRSTSFSVTVGTGESSPVKAEATFEEAFTQEKTKGSEHTSSITATFNVKRGDVGALYAVKHIFTMKRFDGTSISSWEVNGPARFKSIMATVPS